MQDTPAQYQASQSERGSNRAASGSGQLKVDSMKHPYYAPSNAHQHDIRDVASRTIDLNGREISIPTNRAAQMEDPRHVHVTGNIRSTPGYFRIISPVLGIRYLFTGLLNTTFGFKGLQDFNVTEKLGIDGLFGDMSINAVSENQSNLIKGFVDLGGQGETLKQLKEAHPAEYAGAVKELKKTSYSKIEDQALKKMLDGDAGVAKDLDKEFKDNLRGAFFDSALGGAMLVATTHYAQRVMRDIVETYAETVAYEKHKNPKDITWKDVFSSENKIVKETCDNYIQKNMFRYATDISFFGRSILGHIPGLEAAQRIPFGDIAMGVKAATLLTETQRPNTSMFIDLTDLIDQKLNPQKGLGSPISGADLFDLYQKYQLTNDPSKQFNNATRHDDHDGQMQWRTSNAIFSRMAELMNTTYVYKHGSQQGLDEESLLRNDILSNEHYFTMPKYLHLLGHDMIDPTQPEKTLAYMEVANRWSIPDVMELKHQLEDLRMPLADALRSHPVDLEATLGTHCSEALKKVSAFSREVDNALFEEALERNVDLKERYDSIKRAYETEAQPKETEQQHGTHAIRDLNSTASQVAFVEDGMLHIPVNQQPLPSFFPADSSSLRHSNENINQAQPRTQVEDIRERELVTTLPLKER